MFFTAIGFGGSCSGAISPLAFFHRLWDCWLIEKLKRFWQHVTPWNISKSIIIFKYPPKQIKGSKVFLESEAKQLSLLDGCCLLASTECILKYAFWMTKARRAIHGEVIKCRKPFKILLWQEICCKLNFCQKILIMANFVVLRID